MKLFIYKSFLNWLEFQYYSSYLWVGSIKRIDIIDLKSWTDYAFQSLLWLTLLFLSSGSQSGMIAKLEIFGLKYSELFACHTVISGHISYNYSNSSENGIWKKYVSLAMVTRQFIQTFAKKIITLFFEGEIENLAT